MEPARPTASRVKPRTRSKPMPQPNVGPAKPKRQTKRLVPRGKRVDAATVAARVENRKRLGDLQREIEEISRNIENANSLAEKVRLRKLFEKKDEERDELYKKTVGPLQEKKTNVNLNAVNSVNLNALNLDDFEIRPIKPIKEVISLKGRRARNRETRKQKKKEKMELEKLYKLMTSEPIKVEMPKMTIKDRKAMNAARLAELDLLASHNKIEKAVKLAEDLRTKEARDKAAEDDAEAERLVKQMVTSWKNPEVLKERKLQSVMEAKQKGFYSQHAQEGNAPNELMNMMIKEPKPKPKPKPKTMKRL